MDPNENIRQQNYLLSKGDLTVNDRRRLRELKAALAGWLRSGGFRPTVKLYSSRTPKKGNPHMAKRANPRKRTRKSARRRVVAIVANPKRTRKHHSGGHTKRYRVTRRRRNDTPWKSIAIAAAAAGAAMLVAEMAASHKLIPDSIQQSQTKHAALMVALGAAGGVLVHRTSPAAAYGIAGGLGGMGLYFLGGAIANPPPPPAATPALMPSGSATATTAPIGAVFNRLGAVMSQMDQMGALYDMGDMGAVYDMADVGAVTYGDFRNAS